MYLLNLGYHVYQDIWKAKCCGMGLFDVMYCAICISAHACKGEALFWNNHILHGGSGGIYNMVKQCQTCEKQNTQTRLPLLPTKLPAYPWQRVASDLFTLKGVNYLVVVDYFS